MLARFPSRPYQHRGARPTRPTLRLCRSPERSTPYKAPTSSTPMKPTPSSTHKRRDPGQGQGRGPPRVVAAGGRYWLRAWPAHAVAAAAGVDVGRFAVHGKHRAVRPPLIAATDLGWLAVLAAVVPLGRGRTVGPNAPPSGPMLSTTAYARSVPRRRSAPTSGRAGAIVPVASRDANPLVDTNVSSCPARGHSRRADAQPTRNRPAAPSGLRDRVDATLGLVPSPPASFAERCQLPRNKHAVGARIRQIRPKPKI